MNPFIEELRPLAIQYGRKGNVLPSLILAQAVLESGMSLSTLTQKTNNLFGIKKGGGWSGEVFSIKTAEWSEEKGWFTVIAEFRKYPSYAESVADLVALYQSPRYADVLNQQDYIEATQATHAAGYATDPTYPKKLQNVIELYQLDTLTTKGVENVTVSVFTLMERSIKNMGAVNPKVKDLALELIKRAYHEGITVQITSGYRSNAEQTKLYNQGRTTPGNIVTNAKAGQSIHNYGLAIDYVLVSADGTKAIWNVTDQWRRVAAIGKQLGFQWGGDWKSFRDYPHLDMQRGVSISNLAAGKRPSIPNVPKRGYLGVGDISNEVKQMQKDLTKAGYKTDADGTFGTGTEDTVKRFQRANNLAVDGFFGSSSESKLKAIIAQGTKPEPIVKPTEPKPTPPAKVEETQKEDEQVKMAIVIGSAADFGYAEVVSARKNIGIYPKNGLPDYKLEEVILIGADKSGINASKFTDLSGKDRFETSDKVREYISK